MTMTVSDRADRVPVEGLAAARRADTPAWPAFAGVRVVAFDLDCTLVDIIRVKRHACEAAAWALADAGLDEAPEALADSMMRVAYEVGIDRDDVVARFLQQHLGDPSEQVATLAQRAYERAEDASAIPYPRAHRTLVELARRGYRLALISDAPRHRVDRRLRATRLSAFFDPIIALEDTPRGKADPRPFQLLLDRTKVDARQVVMVGDNPHRDIGVARALGCRTVLAQYGLQDAFASDEPAHRPHRAIDWLDELLGILPGATMHPSATPPRRQDAKTRQGS